MKEVTYSSAAPSATNNWSMVMIKHFHLAVLSSSSCLLLVKQAVGWLRSLVFEFVTLSWRMLSFKLDRTLPEDWRRRILFAPPPLLGYAGRAIEQAQRQSDGEWFFPRYIRDGLCRADNASAALNKWSKKDFDGLTGHSLRHTMRDRLRAVEYPIDMIDEIGGWKSVTSIGNSYGRGFTMEQRHLYLENIMITWLSVVSDKSTYGSS